MVVEKKRREETRQEYRREKYKMGGEGKTVIFDNSCMER